MPRPGPRQSTCLISLTWLKALRQPRRPAPERRRDVPELRAVRSGIRRTPSPAPGSPRVGRPRHRRKPSAEARAGAHGELRSTAYPW